MRSAAIGTSLQTTFILSPKSRIAPKQDIVKSDCKRLTSVKYTCNFGDVYLIYIQGTS
jgi:hypothetical protein